MHGTLRQIADFLGDNCKAAAMVTGTRRLNRGIKSQKLDTLADIFNCTQNLVGTFGLGFKFRADAFKVASDGLGLAGNGRARGVLNIPGDVGTIGNFATGFIKTGAQIVRPDIDLAHQAVLTFASRVGKFQKVLDVIKRG